jgi:hypothetical protein
MRKSISIMLALVVIFGLYCTAFAAVSMYSDVPLKHWAYDSIAKLAKAGIIEGYGNNTFNGEKALTRYEMATIVANALTKQEKADAATKAEIVKLQAEFSDELTQMGVRLDNVEKKVNGFGNTQFSMFARLQYESAKDSNTAPNNFFLRYRLNMITPLDNNVKFVARWGTDDFINSTTTTQTTNVVTQKALVKIDAGNGWGFNIGRQNDNESTGSTLGTGFLLQSTQGWDGINIQKVDNKVNLGLGWFRKYTGAGPNIVGTTTPSVAAGMRTWEIANLVYSFTPYFKMTGTYVKDNGLRNGATALDDTKRYDYTSVGEVYRFGADHMWWIISEYGENKKAYINGSNNNTAKGGFVALKYGITDIKKPGSWDVKLEYRKAQTGFDQLWNGGNSDLGEVTCGSNAWGGIGNELDNVKGNVIYYEFVPWKNVFTQLSLYNLKNNDGTGNSRRGFRLMNDFAF